MAVSLYDRLISAMPDVVRNSAGTQKNSPSGQTWETLLDTWSEQLQAKKMAAEEELQNARLNYLYSVIDRQSRADAAPSVSGFDGAELFRDYAAKMRLLHPEEPLSFYL